MFYTIETLTENGWTDDPTYLGSADNRWPTEAEALEACDDLAAVAGFSRSSLRVVGIEPVPTVDEVLARCKVVGWKVYSPVPTLAWNGSMIPADELRAALEDAYDPTMPNWPAMVQLDA